jgi:hypothetical protein
MPRKIITAMKTICRSKLVSMVLLFIYFKQMKLLKDEQKNEMGDLMNVGRDARYAK